MKIETERWFVMVILIIIVILFVKLLFILNDKNSGVALTKIYLQTVITHLE